jgi:Uma2 family endonuclease
MLSALPKISAAEFRELPAGPPYFQLIEGHLLMSPSPSTPHQNIILNLAVLLRVYLIAHPGSGAIFVSPIDVYLTEENVFQPDLVFLSPENQSLMHDHGIVGAPDLVVEVLSPSTGKYDKENKRRVYKEAGVKALWLIFPAPKRIEIYDYSTGVELMTSFGINDTFSSPFFPGLKIKVADLFAPPFISIRPD